MGVPEADLVPIAASPEGPPPARTWSDKNPAAAARLAACRLVITELCEVHDLPAENLLTPDLVRRLAWEPPVPLGSEQVAAELRAGGARPWQIALTVERLTAALDADDEEEP
jgi:ribonuclease D